MKAEEHVVGTPRPPGPSSKGGHARMPGSTNWRTPSARKPQPALEGQGAKAAPVSSGTIALLSLAKNAFSHRLWVINVD